MEFEILQENLLNALVKTIRFVPSKPQLPILEGILIEAENGTIKLVSCDMENSLAQTLGAKVEQEGRIVVPGKTFFELVGSLPSGKVKIETENEILKISLGKTKTKLNTFSAEEYPPTLKSEEVKLFLKLPSSLFSFVAKKISFAVSTDVVTRPVLTGVLFDNKEKRLKIVATDGFRLALLETSGFEGDFRLVVPAKIIEEVAKETQKKEDLEIEIFLNEKKTSAIFKFDNIEIGARLIEGNYPPYEKIIPQKNTLSAKIDFQDFFQAVKISSIFAKETASGIKLAFEKEFLKVSSSVTSLGENESELEVEKTGENKTLEFNSRFLLDFLSRASTDKILFENEESQHPGVFKEEGKRDYLYLIMPLKN